MKRMIRGVFLVGLAAYGWAQPTHLSVVQVSNTGAALCYDAADMVTNYTVEVSVDPSFTPLVNDVNAALFAASAQDLARPDTVVNGTNRCVQIGHTGKYFKALDGSSRDRVLEANRTHYWRVGGVAGPAFQTSNIPNTIVHTQPLPTGDATFTPNLPTLNPNYQSQFRDSITGLLLTALPDYGLSWASWTGETGRTFDLAESAVWTASSGTLADAIDVDDNIYAQVSVEQQPLLLGLGDANSNKFPKSGTDFTQNLAFQNLLIRVDCNGSGCGSGIDAEVALTFDGVTAASAWKTFTATTTETEVRVCHPEQAAPACATAKDPGDWWSYAPVQTVDWALGTGLIWNGGSCTPGTNPVCFHTLSDCQRMRVNDTMRWWFGGQAIARVLALHCGDPTPWVQINDSWPADNNGNTGIPFMFAAGVQDNQRFGFLVRKKSAVANATLRVDSASWVAAAQISTADCGFGSGGFSTRFQEIDLTTPGGYIFANCNNGFWRFKTLPDGSLDAKFMGYGRFGMSGSDAIFFSPGPETFTWSTTEPGVFYLVFSADGVTSPLTGKQARYLTRVQFNHPDIACGEPGTTCTLPAVSNETFAIADVTVTNMTPCLNSCTTAADDYTLGGQVMRVAASAGFDPNRWSTPGIAAVQGSSVLLLTRETSADSFGWMFAVDLGGTGTQGTDYMGQYGNTQRLYAYNATFATIGCRWAGFHTHQPVIGPGENFTVCEFAAESGSKYQVELTTGLNACTVGVSCTPCPSIVIDGENLSGQNSCDTIHITSPTGNGGAWNSGWETQPVTYEDGDPVNTGACSACSLSWHWIQKLRVGDMLRMGGLANFEEVKLVQRVSNTEWVVRRGCTYDQSFAGPKTYPVGFRMNTVQVDALDCPHRNWESGGQLWYFTADHNGSDTVTTPYTNHAFFMGKVRANGGYLTNILNDPSDWNEVKQRGDSVVPVMPGTFAGIEGAPAQPNAVEQHPNYSNWNAPEAAYRTAQFDAHPLSFIPTEGWTSETGSMYSLTSTLFQIAPRQFPLFAFQGRFAFQRTDAIDGSPASWGKWCYAIVSGDCFSGSTAGKFYINGPLDTSQTCAEVEFWSGQLDTCFGNQIAKAASSAAQTRIPPDSTTQLMEDHFRSLSKDTTFRAAATANVKTHPDGKWVFYRAEPYGTNGVYGKVPPFPKENALIDHTTFVPREITVNSLVPGTQKLRVKFGYDELFECNTNSSRACYAVSASVNPALPFLWEGEAALTGAGVTCSSPPCSVQIPFVEGRILRYQVQFLDGSGAVLASSAPSFDIGVLPFAPNTTVSEITSEAMPRQIRLAYTAPDANSCTVEVSTNANYSPLLHDVDSGLYSGSNIDLSRASTVWVGLRRFLVLGSAVVPDRELPSNTRLYIRLGCGAAHDQLVEQIVETEPTGGQTDTVNRAALQPIPVVVNKVPIGATRLLIRFGYDDSYHCSTGQAEFCYAATATVNDASPFLLESQLTNTSGVDLTSGCSGGCVVTLPVEAEKVVRYQLVYRDAGGTVLYASTPRTAASH